jgi:hypothetical protein
MNLCPVKCVSCWQCSFCFLKNTFQNRFLVLRSTFLPQLIFKDQEIIKCQQLLLCRFREIKQINYLIPNLNLVCISFHLHSMLNPQTQPAQSACQAHGPPSPTDNHAQCFNLCYHRFPPCLHTTYDFRLTCTVIVRLFQSMFSTFITPRWFIEIN